MADEPNFNQGEFSRRRFLFTGATALGGVAALRVPAFTQATTRAGAAAAGGAQNAARRKVLHIIGHSHIDAAWLWPWRDGSNTVLTTMRSALDRMRETPAFRYSHSSTAHYEWVERADPSMFAEIKERVREGRWELVGGWPVEPDCNIPSTESLIRHCLYGKNYFQRAFGVDVQIGFNPDSFGHPAGLPSVLRGAGYRYYVFMRPQEHEMKLPLLFWWESPDGSRVLALRIRRGYSEPANRLRLAAENNFQEGFDHAAFFLGVGNHGGSVTKEQIKQVAEMQQDATLPELRWSTVTEFFKAVEASPAAATLPVVSTELQYHSRGVYSAHGEFKQLNRRAERWLGQAEAISLAATVGVGHRYPAQEYAAAWGKVLFNQFHDLMAGTAQYVAYRDARDQMGAACDTALTNTVESLEAMARRVDTRAVKEGAVFAFNPLPWPRKCLVEYHTERNPGGNPWIPVPAGVVPVTHLETKDGQKVPLQFRPSDSMTQVYPRLSAWVDLPACGYKVFEVVHGTPPETPPHNNFFSVNDEGFGISSLKSTDGKELLAAPIGLVVIGDPSDTWGHGVTKYRAEAGRPTFVSSQQIEDGAVTRVIRQRARWQNSEIVLDIAQFKAIDAVELRFTIDWREREQILKLEVPTAFAAPRVFAKVPGAAIERQPDGDEQPYQDWVAVGGRIGGDEHTLGLVNNSTYSYDCKGGLLRTVLIRSAPFARHDPFQVPHNDNGAWQDQGRQERRFWLVRGRGAFGALELDRLADEMQTPAEYVMDSAHEGTEPWERSFFRLAPGNVALLSLKRAERGDGTIVRVQERAGRATEFTLESAPLGVTHRARIGAWEIKTLFITGERGGKSQVREVNLLER
ncbi:MAG TPA: glycoside hydrolase family 38 C-terminal domain-containing protein [Pyrinomonadaceae bacterium]|jgi:alpha-mannosidase|nr:glycoside hydrolase family 38 C-terminal domain-containing protein [Pyrinomonadaceae bacterium]